MSSDEMYSSSVVGSVVDEKGVEVFDHIAGSVTKKHLGVLWGIVHSVLEVEFGDFGARGKGSRSWEEDTLSNISFNLIPYVKTYEGY